MIYCIAYVIEGLKIPEKKTNKKNHLFCKVSISMLHDSPIKEISTFCACFSFALQLPAIQTEKY